MRTITAYLSAGFSPRPPATRRPGSRRPGSRQSGYSAAIGLPLLALTATLTLAAQSERGEIDIAVTAKEGTPLPASGTILSQGSQFRQSFQTDPYGRFSLNHLVFGTYTVTLTAPGFAPISRHVEVDTPLPRQVSATLTIATLQQNVSVSTPSTLIDEQQAGSGIAIGRAQLDEKITGQPGRSFLDVINDQPGWLFEANGVLHPRGSEYDTQFIVNGVPRTENLSPSYAATISANAVESAQVRTAGIPAEYGRSLGGVIDITTGNNTLRNWHGAFAASGGSFDSAIGDLNLSYGTARQQFAISANAYRTDRFLDSPVLDNFTNRATAFTPQVDEQITLSPRDKLQLDLSFGSLHSMVPNEAVQQQAGQRQDRTSRQTSGSASWQHTLSPDLLFTAGGSVLDTDASLSSNPEATPVFVTQDRGFRQGWLHADVDWHQGHNEWKAGVDAILRHVHERLNYTITDPDFFDPDTQQTLAFAQEHWDSEPAGFVEDTLHISNWNIAAGLRYDNYAFVVHRDAFSPRVAISRYIPAAHLVLHASYDRIFQVPAVENLLLASSPELDSASSFVERLPVEPARANYYEGGFSEEIAHLRITGNVFLRTFHNYSDDDTLLNTGVSFPIATATARIHGEELTIYLPEYRHVLAQLSYSNQNGTAAGPITGGLFIGDEGAQELATTGSFPISQDQRNTLRGRVRWSPIRPLWLGLHEQYNSGLPVELDDTVDIGQLRAEYGDAIVNAINFDRGRVRPWSSTDLSAGTNLLTSSERKLDLEFNVINVTNRVNVINFASLFSGTAIGSPRSYQARMRFSF